MAGTPDFRIFNVFSGIVSISGLAIRNGRDNVGGGIHNEATLTLGDCAILGNAATLSGGGINNLSTLTLSNCVVGGNSIAPGVAGGFGGGLHNAGTVVALKCLITSNSVAGLKRFIRATGIKPTRRQLTTPAVSGETSVTG